MTIVLKYTAVHMIGWVICRYCIDWCVRWRIRIGVFVGLYLFEIFELPFIILVSDSSSWIFNDSCGSEESD